MRHYFWLFILTGLAGHTAFSQSGDTLRELTVNLEVRPRAEFRNNFTLAPADSIMPELYATQRNRLSITYSSPGFKFHASPQEIHVWGRSGKASQIGSINAFELYIEPSLTKYLTARIGRQALSLDNGRIFSAAPWSQQGRAHEGIRILYNKKITTDLALALTRRYGKQFDPSYSPVAAHQYKFLLVHHFKKNLNPLMVLTTINTMEFFEKQDKNNAYYRRITNGGRLEYTSKWFYGTINGYYQYGRTTASKRISAFYIQPEISASLTKATIRLGAEILSGNSSDTPMNLSHSFVPLYGVAWKFMGNMNLFTRFPADVNDKGLINPYLFFLYQVNKKLSLRADAHLFYTQHDLSGSDTKLTDKYLGFENDISLNFKPVKKVEIIFGFSSTFADKRMELLNKIPDSNKVPIWSYLMISYAPDLLRHRMSSLK